MEITSLQSIENATRFGRSEMFRFGTVMLFIVGVMLFSSSLHAPVSVELVIAAMIGGYMAMNIGANDVANNVGPAVGSKALTLTGAILIAAIFEALGATVAGGDVVSTIKKGIIDPSLVPSGEVFIWLMMAALLAAAIWLNIATAIGAPVSTTHSIVGGVLGAGIAAGGPGIANWDRFAVIAASWVISPLIGGIVAAGFLYWMKHSITYKKNMIEAARRMVPTMVSLMVWAFSTYLIIKGLKKLINVELLTAAGLGLVAGLVTYLVAGPLIARYAQSMTNEKKSVNSLFTVPLIFAAALLSFAHGANDVANAVGPLAAIADSVTHHGVATKAPIPLWVMAVGAVGIVLGLALFGPKLIRTVGSEITELDQMRAFCIAMAAAITVIIASQLGLPVSSTHIAVGGVFGVGFLREYLKTSYAKTIQEIEHHHTGTDKSEVETFMEEFGKASIEEKRVMLERLKARKASADLSKRERKGLKKVYRTELVKRSALLKIAAAWVITVPAAGIMSALLFFTIRGMLLPRQILP
ncbi:MAG: inorganic phosphate transporter [Deltaproteobacteria bacterium]|nr:inorganic phosphate transporter [Deltaproteobacteria bacterium]